MKTEIEKVKSNSDTNHILTVIFVGIMAIVVVMRVSNNKDVIVKSQKEQTSIIIKAIKAL